MPPKKGIYAPKGQKTLSSFINHEKDSNNNNAHSHIDMEIGDESQYSVTDDTTTWKVQRLSMTMPTIKLILKQMNRTPENTELYGKNYGHGSILMDRRCYVKKKKVFV
jgi:hypothetical protein